MKLIVKMATRSRPEKFKSVMQRYFDLLSGKHDIRFVISCDEDDETMNNDEMKLWFEENQKTYDLKYVYGHSKTKVEACNADLDDETGDVLLVASDDMVPVMEEYDDIIYQAFQKTFPDYDGAVKFNDGLRNDMLMTLPCLGWKLYKAIGHVYHPDYTSLYCDNEQTQVCYMLNKLAATPTCIINHQWVPGNHELADELHKRNENPEMYAKDKVVFDERAKIMFDIDKVRENLEALEVA